MLGNCEPPHAHSPGVAVARSLRIDVHDDNDNAWQRGPKIPKYVYVIY